MVQELKRGAATALVALAQKVSLQEPVDEGEVRQLIASVCADQTERVAFLRACRQANDPDLRLILCDMLRGYATDRMVEVEKRGGADTAAGPWAQGIGLGFLAFNLSTVVAGKFVGGLALAATGLTVLLLLGATAGRLYLMMRRAEAKQDADRAGDLLKSLSELKPDSADPVKTPRK